MNKIKKHYKHYPDIKYTISITEGDNQLFVEFELYRIVGEEDNGYMYANIASEPTHNIEEVTPEFIGSIKWDGCSNWNIPEDDVCLHFCSAQEVINFNLALQACYEIARLILPNFED